MFLREILDLVVPLKIELNKRLAITDLLMKLNSMQEEVTLLIKKRSDALSKATSIEEFKIDIEKISDVLSIMAIILPQGVALFGSSYNAVHPEEKTPSKRRRKSLGHIRATSQNSNPTEEAKNRRPLFQRKRRLGNTDRVLSPA